MLTGFYHRFEKVKKRRGCSREGVGFGCVSELRKRGGSPRGLHSQTGSKVGCSETVACIYIQDARPASLDVTVFQ
jgi:hypothetical protein